MNRSWAVDRALRGIGQEPGAEPFVVLLADRPIDRPPPDLVLAGCLADDELVLGRATGMATGPDDQGPLGCDQAFTRPDRVLVQLGGGQVRAQDAAD